MRCRRRVTDSGASDAYNLQVANKILSKAAVWLVSTVLLSLHIISRSRLRYFLALSWPNFLLCLNPWVCKSVQVIVDKELTKNVTDEVPLLFPHPRSIWLERLENFLCSFWSTSLCFSISIAGKASNWKMSHVQDICYNNNARGIPPSTTNTTRRKKKQLARLP